MGNNPLILRKILKYIHKFNVQYNVIRFVKFRREIMKNKYIMPLFTILFITLISLGCVEYEYSNQLSSDLIPLEKNTLFTVNDSNLTMTFKCEQQKMYSNTIDKFSITGNVTNTGSETIYFSNIGVSFYTRNGKQWDNNEISTTIYSIKPNEIIPFKFEKKYADITYIKKYKINMLY